MRHTKNEQMEDYLQISLQFAARYAHHRDTGASLVVCKAIERAWPMLGEDTRRGIIQESYEATCNRDDWQRMREKLVGECLPSGG